MEEGEEVEEVEEVEEGGAGPSDHLATNLEINNEV